VSPSPSPEEPLGAALATVRERLARGLVFTGERLQETIDDTVKRGRMTHKDAEDLAQRLVTAGRRQTEELLCELEQIVERGGGEFVRASRRVRDKLR
jgi:polyhydroxyalkanoate synthesis regulator phasin